MNGGFDVEISARFTASLGRSEPVLGFEESVPFQGRLTLVVLGTSLLGLVPGLAGNEIALGEIDRAIVFALRELEVRAPLRDFGRVDRGIEADERRALRHALAFLKGKLTA